MRTNPTEFISFLIGHIIPHPETVLISGYPDDRGWIVLVFPADTKTWASIVGKVGYTVDCVKYLMRMYAMVHGAGVVKLKIVKPDTDLHQP